MSERYPQPSDDMYSAANMFEAILKGARGHKVATVAIATGAVAIAGGITAAAITHKRKTYEYLNLDSISEDNDVSGNI